MRHVRRTVEFARVASLPRRTISRVEAAEWARAFTREFARRGGVSLRPWQGLALAEAAACRGAWCVLPVGAGKTLLSYLLPRALGAKRAILIAPASLRAKTHSDFTGYFGSWDNGGHALHFVSLESLAREDAATFLETRRPDLIVIDECDMLANAKASAVRRLDRYIAANDDVMVVAMTGTPARNSLMTYWHLLCWCLRDRAPVPLNQDEAQLWADALDNRRITVGSRPKPGPLGTSLAAARSWFRDRLNQTPGCLVVDEDSCDAPLDIRVILAPEDPILDEAFREFLTTGTPPGGIPVTDSLSRWRTEGQMGDGFFQYWDPTPPEEWVNARRLFAGFVRAMIEHSAGWERPLDTEAQVANRYKNHPAVTAWREIKDTFTPNTKVEWLTDSAVQFAADWIRECDRKGTPGIVWCGSTEFRQRLAKATGLPSYGRNGLNERGESLHAAPRGTSIIVSWHANKRGFNLQPWGRQLLTMPPPSAKYVEQIIGRSHRAGRKETVVVEVLASSGAALDSFEAMLAEARHVNNTVGIAKKVLRARIGRAEPVITDGNKYRWARKGNNNDGTDENDE